MNAEQASRTAEYMAFFRALESAQPRASRLFEDRYAVCFLRPGLLLAAKASRWSAAGALIARYADHRLPGARTSAIARTRVIDDAVRDAIRRGIDQVVILGAGFDCRAYRLPELAGATVFEVDHPATRAFKLARLQSVVARLPPNVRSVAIDFNRERLPSVLENAGFDSRRRALFLWEGVTNYLTADAVDAVLRFVASCAAQTRIVFTYVHDGALDGSGRFDDAAALLRQVAQLGEPWTFGLDPDTLPAYLRERGLSLEEDVGAHDYRVRCFGPAGEKMKGYDFYRIAIAVAGANAPDGCAHAQS